MRGTRLAVPFRAYAEASAHDAGWTQPFDAWKPPFGPPFAPFGPLELTSTTKMVVV